MKTWRHSDFCSGLTASLASLGINAAFDSLSGMWYAIIPVALLNQNFSVCKALFSDYIEEQVEDVESLSSSLSGRSSFFFWSSSSAT